jgi:energy-converting hydrogenase Eha subunit E
MASFEKITGKKTNKWLVKQVGLLAAAIGISLLFAQYPDKRIVAVPAAAAFMTIDFYYAFIKRIPRIYMADGFIQIIFLATWVFVH